MSPVDTLTTGEQVENTLVAVAGLIGINSLPGPLKFQLDMRRVPTVDVVLADLPRLRRWAEAADAEVVHAFADTWLAFTVFGGVRLVLSATDKAVPS
jgi:hypothetical protein